MTDTLNGFATAPRGLTGLLVEELRTLGVEVGREHPAGVHFRGDLAGAYRVCLWSRLASRVLLHLAGFPAEDADDLYAGVRRIDWSRHMAPTGTLAVDFTGQGAGIRHTRFGAQKVKDGIVDRFRERFGGRPSVRRERPDLRVRAHLGGGRAEIYLDLAGEPLHRRGYRTAMVAAPLKENLAAAILLRAGWPAIAGEWGGLFDPLCGSGTLLVEGALMAGDIAPGLLRDHFGFLRWKGHDASAWTALVEKARERRAAGRARIPPIVGTDRDPRAVDAARAAVAAAGLEDIIVVRQAPAEQAGRPREQYSCPTGLVVTNPPYGKRLGEVEQLRGLYQALGRRLVADFSGWKAAVFTANPDLGRAIGLRAARSHRMYNGALECRLLRFELDAANVVDRGPRPPLTAARLLGDRREAHAREAAAGMVANRLRKNRRRLKALLNDATVGVYRLYDADIPEHAVRVDGYRPADGSADWLVVTEYRPPVQVDRDRARAHLCQAVAGVLEATGLPAERVLIHRADFKGDRPVKPCTVTVAEAGGRFELDLADPRGRVLAPERRGLRRRFVEGAAGVSVLQLGAADPGPAVLAARAGATPVHVVAGSEGETGVVERSRDLDGIDPGRLVIETRAAADWLAGGGTERVFDRVLLDLDGLERGTPLLRSLGDALARVAPGGELWIVAGHRRWQAEAVAGQAVEDHSDRLLPEDCRRHPERFGCWRIRS